MRAVMTLVLRQLRRLARDRRGASAVEFALVSVPLIMMLLMIIQMGIYYMAKSSLDAGVVQTADILVCTFNAGTGINALTSTITVPSTCNAAGGTLSGAGLKTLVSGKGGGLVHNDTTLAVDLRLLTVLALAVVPIADGQVDASTYNAGTVGSVTSILVLRAESRVPWFMPWISIGSLGGTCAGATSVPCIRSTAIVRRQS